MRKPWEFINPNCEGMETDYFFPELREWDGNHQAAIRICQRCEYRIDCLDYALKNRVLGIWGGTSMLERNRIRKTNNIIPVPVIPERIKI